MQLNPSQNRAKNQINGPLLILAGAGSGKTRTLISRIEYMISQNINPSSILRVTFTNKASRELKERVSKTLGVNYNMSPFKNSNLPMVGTFHSIGVYILKNHIENIGYSKNFTIYDTSDKLQALKDIIKNELNLDDNMYKPRSIAAYISSAKNSGIGRDIYYTQVDSHQKEIVNNVYKIYDQRLRQSSALDFDDILLKTLEILQISEILEYYQERWKYIMVDEYQDTNEVQYQIIKLLSSKYKNLAVVGDDAQSIYSWRGANMQNILNFERDYKDALVIKLEQNYRSTQNIINASNFVIKNNKSSIDKTLFTANDIGDRIIYIDAPTDRLESQTIAKIIKDKGYDYSKSLILYRTNAQSRSIEEALMMEAIPYKVVGGLRFYDRVEIKDMLAYLKLIHNQNDIISLKRIINTPSRKIGPSTIKKIDNYSRDFGISYYEIIKNIDELDELGAGAKNAISNFYEIINYLIEYSKTHEVAALLTEIIAKIRYNSYLKKDLTNDEYEAKLQNLDEFKNTLSVYDGLDGRESLTQALDEVLLLTDEIKDDMSHNYVTLMTIHSAKGLEFDRVFVTGLEEGLFPGSRSIEDPSQLEEERRLMYVAMTRAKLELYISKASERYQYGSYVRSIGSRFIDEIPSEYIEEYKFSTTNNLFTTSFSFDSNIDEPKTKIVKNLAQNDVSSFGVGDALTHPKFGIGNIISLSGDIGEVKFKAAGIKKMNLKIAPVKKI